MRSARWGLPLLAASVVLVVAMAWATVAVGPVPAGSLVTVVLPAVAAVLGALALFAGHVSYPRVQNLRVYLAGYSVGLQGVIYALFVGFAGSRLTAAPPAPDGYRELHYVLALLAAAACSVLPAFPTYRTTRLVTWVFVTVQVLLFAVVRFLPASYAAARLLVPQSLLSFQALAAVLLASGVVTVNAVLRPHSYYLRGAFAGLALIAGFGWILPPLLEIGYGPVSGGFVGLLHAGVAPLFFLAATLAHVLARMEHRVSYDPLLHIYNREYCNQILAEQSSVAVRPPLAVMLIDIDHFKQVNDTYGHQIGDRILFAVAQAVQKAVIPEGIVCRYGGEELIVFFPARAGRDVVPLAKRMRAAIEHLETASGAQRISVTVSIGIADRRSPGHTLAQVVRAADKALYLAKENGRNQVRLVRITEPVPR